MEGEKFNMTLSNIELINVTGGAFSAAFVNAVIGGFSKIMDFGRNIGTAIRRGRTGTLCRV